MGVWGCRERLVGDVNMAFIGTLPRQWRSIAHVSRQRSYSLARHVTVSRHVHAVQVHERPKAAATVLDVRRNQALTRLTTLAPVSIEIWELCSKKCVLWLGDRKLTVVFNQ